MSPRLKKHLLCVLVFFAVIFLTDTALNSEPWPNVNLSVGGDNVSPDGLSPLIKLIFILTLLSIAPAIILLLTSFTRIVVVMSILRHAIGTQQMPPNQVIIGLSLFLTFFIMTPVWQRINDVALKPYYEEQITGKQALEMASLPVKDFMLKQTREKDLSLFVKIAKEKRPEKKTDIPLSVLIPAFVISELKTAFQIGFMVYLPFIIIDMVVSSILLSMGMLMLPPVMVSLPFKLLLFVLVDGWYLIVQSLVRSFR